MEIEMKMSTLMRRIVSLVRWIAPTLNLVAMAS
jgi:hypothetical protein